MKFSRVFENYFKGYSSKTLGKQESAATNRQSLATLPFKLQAQFLLIRSQMHQTVSDLTAHRPQVSDFRDDLRTEK
jgi:hypothetical protein